MSRSAPCLAYVAWGAALLSQLACSSQSAPTTAEDDGDLQSLCGPTRRLADVELYDGSFGLPTAFVNRHRLAVGLLRWRTDLSERYREQRGNVAGRGWCTGTLIADDLFLTAGHCLDSADTPSFQLPREKGGIALEPAVLAREFTVEFRFENPALADAARYGNSAEVVRLEEYSRANPDYAILRLKGNPGFNNGVARISSSDSQPGLPIALLQHPRAEPMKVGAGLVAGLVGSKISYDTIDTLDGSSGAGILDVSTGKLVGIHTNGGCTKRGDGENFGVTIGALGAVSDILYSFVDRSRDFLVGDWNNDGFSDLAVFVDGCLYPDADHDEAPDTSARQCPREPRADQYFAGKWQSGAASELGWRLGNCLYLDREPGRPMCFEAPFEVLVADWNGDGQSDLGIRKGRCIDFDTNLDGALDDPGYCFGEGVADDEYLVGDWEGAGRDSVAIRRANAVFVDVNRDGVPDAAPLVFGRGGVDDQYLVGDWDGSGRSHLGVRRGSSCSIDVGDGLPELKRNYRDFWSTP